VAARWLDRVREVQRACAPETDCTPVVAGTKAQGRRSVAVWLVVVEARHGHAE